MDRIFPLIQPLAGISLLSVILVGCGGGETPQPAPTSEAIEVGQESESGRPPTIADSNAQLPAASLETVDSNPTPDPVSEEADGEGDFAPQLPAATTPKSLAAKKAEEARRKLESNPDDAAAHLALGQYLGLYKNDWFGAVPHLVKSGNPAWMAAATAEQARPGDAERQVQVGEKWLAIAAVLPAGEQSLLRDHAAVWLKEALPKLSGDEEARVKQQLAAIAADQAPVLKESAATVVEVSPEKPETPIPPPSKPTDETAGEEGTIQTAVAGGEGGLPFRWLAPEKAVFIGLRVSSTTPISMLQPVYRTANGIEYGPVFGEEAAEHIDLVAKAGYKVGGISLRTGDYIKGLTVTFQEARASRRPKWYESKYVGEIGPGKVTRIGDPKIPVVGIFGRGEILIDAVGLIQRPIKPKSPVKPKAQTSKLSAATKSST